MEIWKDIKGYEGLYQVSNLGRVKSFPKKGNKWKEKILKNRINMNGYYQVTLFNDRKSANKSVHRLLAIAFIPNPNNYPCVNHKDGNKLNNNLENLEWCSHSYNVIHAFAHHLIKRNVKSDIAIIECNIRKRKKVNQYDLQGNFIKEWNCISNASKEHNLNTSAISLVCKNKKKTAGGYIWRYADDNNLKELR